MQLLTNCQQENQPLSDELFSQLSESVDLNNKQTNYIKITKDDLICMLKNYSLREENITKKQKKSIALKKPSDQKQSKFFFMNPSFGLFDMMLNSYKRKQLKLSEFEYLCYYFKLNNIEIKQVSCTDPFVLQILRYAIHNRQQIIPPLVNIINRMAKCYMKKQWEKGPMIMGKIFFDMYSQVFEPPLDLYIQLVDSKLINPSQSDLIEVFKRNQFLFDTKIHRNQQEQYSQSQKRKLVLYQFPYLVEIFRRISSHPDFNFGRFKYYINLVINVLHYSKWEQLFDRYLPEVTCRYLKIRGNLSSSDIKYLFTCLKSANQLTLEDLDILFPSKKEMLIEGFEFQNIKCWRKFSEIKQLSSNILLNPNLRLTKKRLEEIDHLLSFKRQGIAIDFIVANLCLIILRQVSYRKQIFPKSLLKNLSEILEQIPEERAKKQICFILLQEYYCLLEQKYDINQISLKLPFKKMDETLNEGRILALDLLLQSPIQNFITKQNHRVFQDIIRHSIETNQMTRHKSLQLYQKLWEKNCLSFEIEYFEAKVKYDHNFIYYIQKYVEVGNIISINTVDNIINIIHQNTEQSIQTSCLLCLLHIMKNVRTKCQKLPKGLPLKISNIIILLSQQISSKNPSFQSKKDQTQIKSSKSFLALFEIKRSSSIISSRTLQNISIPTCCKQQTDMLFKLMVQCLINDVLLNVPAFECLTFYALEDEKYIEIVLICLIFIAMNKNESFPDNALRNITKLLTKVTSTSIPFIIKVFSIHFLKKYRQLPKQCKKILKVSPILQKCYKGMCLHMCSFSNQCLYYEVRKKEKERQTKKQGRQGLGLSLNIEGITQI